MSQSPDSATTPVGGMPGMPGPGGQIQGPNMGPWGPMIGPNMMVDPSMMMVTYNQVRVSALTSSSYRNGVRLRWELMADLFTE